MQQANRLGQYLAKAGFSFNHVLSSDLSRAVRTAEAIRTHQTSPSVKGVNDTTAVVQVSALREQDFGFYEGKPFYARKPDSSKSGKDTHREEHKNEPDFQDVESKESMAKRADSFLDEYLLPILNKQDDSHGLSIAVVSHGILLSTLWRCMLRRQSPNTVTLSTVSDTRPVSLERLGGWSNTGYLELEMLPVASPAATNPVQSQPGPDVSPSTATAAVTDIQDSGATITGPLANEPQVAPNTEAEHRYKIVIKTINGKEHLQGLKRTGGGVGSSKYDEGQKTIESFFKRPKK